MNTVRNFGRADPAADRGPRIDHSSTRDSPPVSPSVIAEALDEQLPIRAERHYLDAHGSLGSMGERGGQRLRHGQFHYSAGTRLRLCWHCRKKPLTAACDVARFKAGQASAGGIRNRGHVGVRDLPQLLLGAQCPATSVPESHSPRVCTAPMRTAG